MVSETKLRIRPGHRVLSIATSKQMPTNDSQWQWLAGPSKGWWTGAAQHMGSLNNMWHCCLPGCSSHEGPRSTCMEALAGPVPSSQEFLTANPHT